MAATAVTCWYEVAANVVAVVSVGLLAVPAFHVVRYAHLASRVSRKRSRMTAELAAIADQAVKDLEALRDRWVFWKFLCLLLGTVAAGLAPVLALLGIAFC